MTTPVISMDSKNQEDDLPAILYKYVGIEHWLPQLFSGESLLFSSRTTFNDPFDSRPAFRVSNTPKGKQYIKEIFERRLPDLSPAKRLAAIRQAQNMAGKPLTINTENSQALLDEVGILCLSSEWDNILLWSHYANHHKGICIGFRTAIDVFQLAHKDNYDDALPIICRPDDDLDTMIIKTFLTKAKCWAYEKEWRITKPKLSQEEKDRYFGYHDPASFPPDYLRVLKAQDGAKFYSFAKASIESVTLGMRVSPSDQSVVLSALRKAGLSVPLYKVPRPCTEYRLTRKRTQPDR